MHILHIHLYVWCQANPGQRPFLTWASENVSATTSDGAAYKALRVLCSTVLKTGLPETLILPPVTQTSEHAWRQRVLLILSIV